MWGNKKVLVTGSEGMIGKELVIQLEVLGADVFKFDIKRNLVNQYPEPFEEPKTPLDVTNIPVIDDIFGAFEPDYVFHLFGIKGSVKMTKERPVDYMGPMLQGDINIILAAQKHKVKKFLYTSSIAVENPKTDRYPAWAKQTSEVLIEAMRIQYPKGTEYCIVRPANVYGRFDNFNNPDAMVITSLISKALNPEAQVLNVWGDGTQVRDFINSKDVARGMIQAMELKMFNSQYLKPVPLNLCSGYGVSVRRIAEIIAKETGKKLEFDTSKPTGDQRRVMKINWDFKPEIDIEEGIKEVINVQRSNSNKEI